MKVLVILGIVIIVILAITLLLILTLKRKETYNNKTIAIKSGAGLGNQIFQIAFIYALSLKNNLDYIIIYSNDNYHTKDNGIYYSNIFKNFKKTKSDVSFDNKYSLTNDKFAIFEPEILNINKNTLFDGYFQNEKYFIDYKDKIIDMLTNNNIYMNIKDNNSYFIHIRRGDFISNKKHLIDLDIYYQNAIDYILSKDKNAYFYIISDDIQYCKEYNVLKNINKTFYENNNELETLYFMSKCNKGGICPNSTFSWWGSYLNKNPMKIVTFPDKWLNTDEDTSDIYYKGSLVLSTTQIYPIKNTTVISGYWKVNNKHGNDYEKWFSNTLLINCPYIFFGDNETIKLVKKIRKNLPTFYVNIDIKDFYTYKYIDYIKTDSIHCPSKELNIIWNEKIFLVKKAKDINIFNSEYFLWVDAGICVYREKAPPTIEFPVKNLEQLPKDKFVFTTSDNKIFEKEKINNRYYHYISGTSFLLHINFVDIYTLLYKKYIDIFLIKNDLYTDQMIHTLIYNDNPTMFYKIGDGYGKIVEILFNIENFQEDSVKIVPNNNYYLSIGCIFKNEAHGLYEFIEHNILHGIDHIYLINDFSTDNYLEILQPYIDNNIVTLFNNDIITKEKNRQIMIYEKYFRNILKQTKYIAIIDLDEYLYSPETIDIKNILKNYENYNKIIVEWLTYGSNNCYYQPFSIVDTFNKHHDNNINGEHHYSYKSILLASDIIDFGVHTSTMRNDKSINLSYTTKQYKLLINHYQQQSREFYLTIKAARGDADNHFNSIGLKRDINHFKLVDSNIIENNTLRDQNFNIIKKVKERKIKELTKPDITMVITSCNRPKLLEKTLDSFFKFNTYPIKEIIIIDDSGKTGVNDFLLKRYKYSNFILLYNKRNIGQVNSIDIAYRYITTKYVFHCEEDWEFLEYNFIINSMKILEHDPKIFTVWLRPHDDTSNHPIIYDTKYNITNINYYKMDAKYTYNHNNNTYIWCGFTFNPGLRRTSDVLKYHPYIYYCNKDKFRNEVTEYEINEKYRDDGYYAVIMDNKTGYCKHIGYSDHVLRKDEL